MNFLKNALIIAMVMITNPIIAKSLRQPATTTSTTATISTPVKTPIKPPVTQQQPPVIQPQPPVMQRQSYKTMVNEIKNTPNAWDNTKKLLKADFVTTTVNKARAANLEDFQIDALLQTARDAHAQFSNNANDNIAILQALENQRVAAIKNK